MSSQLVDLVLPALTADAPHAAELAAEQEAWLDAARISLRSVTFSRVTEQQGVSGKLAVSERVLAASLYTLEVTIAFRPPGHDPVMRPHHRVQEPVLAPRLLSSQAAQPHYLNAVQEIHNLHVPKPPQHITALGRFPQLRCLSLLGLRGLKSDQVCAWCCGLSADQSYEHRRDDNILG